MFVPDRVRRQKMPPDENTSGSLRSLKKYGPTCASFGAAPINWAVRLSCRDGLYGFSFVGNGHLVVECSRCGGCIRVRNYRRRFRRRPGGTRGPNPREHDGFRTKRSNRQVNRHTVVHSVEHGSAIDHDRGLGASKNMGKIKTLLSRGKTKKTTRRVAVGSYISVFRPTGPVLRLPLKTASPQDSPLSLVADHTADRTAPVWKPMIGKDCDRFKS